MDAQFSAGCRGDEIDVLAVDSSVHVGVVDDVPVELPRSATGNQRGKQGRVGCIRRSARCVDVTRRRRHRRGSPGTAGVEHGRRTRDAHGICCRAARSPYRLVRATDRARATHRVAATKYPAGDRGEPAVGARRAEITRVVACARPRCHQVLTARARAPRLTGRTVRGACIGVDTSIAPATTRAHSIHSTSTR